MVYQIILIDLWQLVSKALTRVNFDSALFFAICLSIPLENDGYVEKASTIVNLHIFNLL